MIDGTRTISIFSSSSRSKIAWQFGTFKQVQRVQSPHTPQQELSSAWIVCGLVLMSYIIDMRLFSSIMVDKIDGFN